MGHSLYRTRALLVRPVLGRTQCPPRDERTEIELTAHFELLDKDHIPVGSVRFGDLEPAIGEDAFDDADTSLDLGEAEGIIDPLVDLHSAEVSHL